MLPGFKTPFQGLERGPTGFCKILSNLIEARESLIKKPKGKVSRTFKTISTNTRYKNGAGTDSILRAYLKNVKFSDKILKIF